MPLLFAPTPFKELVGHTDVVLDIAWSGAYILSSGTDMTVRMWHLQLDMQLKTFKCASPGPVRYTVHRKFGCAARPLSCALVGGISFACVA